MAGDRLKDAYLKINPNGKIPALIDNSRIIYESTTIAEYLDEQYPKLPLMPALPALGILGLNSLVLESPTLSIYAEKLRSRASYKAAMMINVATA